MLHGNLLLAALVVGNPGYTSDAVVTEAELAKAEARLRRAREAAEFEECRATRAKIVANATHLKAVCGYEQAMHAACQARNEKKNAEATRDGAFLGLLLGAMTGGSSLLWAAGGAAVAGGGDSDRGCPTSTSQCFDLEWYIDQAVAAEGLNEIPECGSHEHQRARGTGPLNIASEATYAYGRAGEEYSRATGEYRQATRFGEAASRHSQNAQADWIAARDTLIQARVVLYIAMAVDAASELYRYDKAGVDDLRGQQGVYRFRGHSGRWYCGKSIDVGRRLAEHTRSGKLPMGESIVFLPVIGDALALATAEQSCIDRFGGVGATENLVNAVAR